MMRLVAILPFLLNYANAGDAPITATSATNDALWAVNEIRKKYGAPEIKNVNGELEKEAQELITKPNFIYATYEGNFCSLHANPRPSDVGGLFLVARGKDKPDRDEITLLITYETDEAARLLKRFPSEARDPKSGIYEPTPVQNLVYLLFSQSDSMGCAATSNCTNSMSVLVCKFSPTWKPDGNIPLTGEVLAAITDGAAKLPQEPAVHPAVRGSDMNKVIQVTHSASDINKVNQLISSATAAAQTPPAEQEVPDSSSAGAQAKGVDMLTVSPREVVEQLPQEVTSGNTTATGPDNSGAEGPATDPTTGDQTTAGDQTTVGGSNTSPGETTTETNPPTSGVTAQRVSVAAVIILSFVGFASV